MPEPQPSDDQPADGRRLRYAGRREELLRSISDYVLEHGTAAVAMRPLAKAVGVSHAALLHHFGSKDELLSAVVESLRHESMPAELATFATAGTAESDPTEMLRDWWTARTAPEELPRFRLTLEVFAQSLLEPDDHRRFLTHFVDDWLTAFERIVLRAGCPPDQASLYATLVLAQIRGLLLHLLATGDRAHVDRAFDLFVDENRARMRRWRGGQLPELPSSVPTTPAPAVPALPETEPEPPALPNPGAGV